MHTTLSRYQLVGYLSSLYVATVQPSYADDVFRRVGWIVQPQRSGQPQIPIVLSVKVLPS